jgi:hypothetical protein
MSIQKCYRFVSLLIVFALLLQATAFLAVTPVAATPLHSEVKTHLAQAATFDIRATVRNRDGLPLPGVNVKLSAYDGPYVPGQLPTDSISGVTNASGTVEWTNFGAAYASQATIRIEQSAAPAGYEFGEIVGLPTSAVLDGQVIQISNVSPGPVVNAGVFVNKRSVPFKFVGTTINQVTGQLLSYANVQLTYTTVAGASEKVPFFSDGNGDWSISEYNVPHLEQFDVVTFTLETLPTDRGTGAHFDQPDAAVTQQSQGIVEDHKIHYRGIIGGTYDGNQLFLSPTYCDQPIVLESEHFKILSCPLPASPNYTAITYTLGVSNALEFAYPKLVAQFNKPPTLLPGENKVIVNVGSNIVVCGIPIAAGGVGLPGQIWLKNNLPYSPTLETIVGGVWQSPGGMAVTAAHELYHLVQWNYLGYDRQDTCASMSKVKSEVSCPHLVRKLPSSISCSNFNA